jgi:hypothetical protein
MNTYLRDCVWLHILDLGKIRALAAFSSAKVTPITFREVASYDPRQRRKKYFFFISNRTITVHTNAAVTHIYFGYILSLSRIEQLPSILMLQ